MGISQVRKFVVAAAAALAVLGAGLADGSLDASEVIAAVVAGLGAAGVYIVPNRPVEDA